MLKGRMNLICAVLIVFILIASIVLGRIVIKDSSAEIVGGIEALLPETQSAAAYKEAEVFLNRKVESPSIDTNHTASAKDGEAVQGSVKEASLFPYKGPIYHIFFHPLIAYPSRAFDNDSLSRGYNDWFITVKEFNRILDSLYANGYILVDINGLFEEKQENGKSVIVKKELRLPENKKPLVLSVDDLNYYDYMRDNGNVFKLIPGPNGNIATFSISPEGKEIVAFDNEIVPLLDAFVETHNDFSLNGAKGVIALTGYQGILGYRTDRLDSPDYETEKSEALKVVKRLKETGWTFASHGYGHLDAKKANRDKFRKDTLRWKKEVEPLTGPTKIYIYPYGSELSAGDDKFKFLLESGFKVMCSVGNTGFMKYSPEYIMMDRRNIDGVAFYYRHDMLLDMFDSRKVLDDVRPPFIPLDKR